MSRREQIEAMLADDPTDQFLRYSLAMELQKVQVITSLRVMTRFSLVRPHIRISVLMRMISLSIPASLLFSFLQIQVSLCLPTALLIGV